MLCLSLALFRWKTDDKSKAATLTGHQSTQGSSNGEFHFSFLYYN